MTEKDANKPTGVAQAAAKRAGAPVRRSPSIKDIARLAQVSHPTVSRALQNSPLVNVETAARIRRIAQAQGYRASAVARGLVTRRTRTIALVTMLDDPASGEVACGVEEAANDHGYAAFLANVHDDPERQRRVLQDLAERRVDGIILTSARASALYLPLLSGLNVPVVLVNDHHPGEPVHTVSIANQEAMRAVVQYLIELGHRRIAYLGDRNSHRPDAARQAGYKAALARAGIGLPPELIVTCDGGPESAIEAMHELLRLNTPPTAVCCSSDMIALGAMRAIRSRRLRVPEDVSVTGFDDLFFAAYLVPPLTTVRQPLRQMGQMAMEILFKLMSGQQAPAQTKFEAELIVRGSTAKPPRRDEDRE
jgi:DNA-binding LacI/PurR family transcriptional regulator